MWELKKEEGLCKFKNTVKNKKIVWGGPGPKRLRVSNTLCDKILGVIQCGQIY